MARIDSKSNAGPVWAALTPLVALLLAQASMAQVPVDENGYPVSPIADSVDTGNYQSVEEAPVQTFTDEELESLIGPIALYPDDLLAIVLPASTYPLQIVQAARFLEEFEADSSLQPDEEWDDAVVALLNYPEVLKQMDADIDWTWKLGEAVVGQQQDVIAAVESFRDRAYAAGNLKSDERQTVSKDEGIIEIVPVDEEIIYVPYYEPERVLISQVEPVYHYYPRPYPVYYYPYPARHYFSSGFFWGVTTAYGIGWSSDHLRVHHHSYHGHPYYGRSYYSHYYRRPSISLHNTIYISQQRRYVANRYRDGDYWRPRARRGARPGYHRNPRQPRRVRNYSPDTVAGTTTTRSTGAARDRRNGVRGADSAPIRFRDRRNTNSRQNSNHVRNVSERDRTTGGDRRQRPRTARRADVEAPVAATDRRRRQNSATGSTNPARRQVLARAERRDLQGGNSTSQRRSQPRSNTAAANTRRRADNPSVSRPPPAANSRSDRKRAHSGRSRERKAEAPSRSSSAGKTKNERRSQRRR